MPSRTQSIFGARPAFAAVVLSVLVTVPSQARAATTGRILEIAKKEAEGASIGSMYSNWYFSWLQEVHDLPSQAEIEALRARVRDKPDHRERSVLEGYDRRLKKGPDVARFEVWFSSRSHWRFNATYLHTTGNYFDIVTDGRIGWGMGPEQLTLIDPTGTIPPGYDYPASEGTILQGIGQFVHPGFVLPAMSRLELGGAVIAGGLWTITASRKDLVTLELSGPDPDPVADRLAATDVRLTRSAKFPGEVGRRWAITLAKNTFPPMILASEVLEYAPDGRLLRRYVLEKAEAKSDEEIRHVFTPPAIDGTDPIRGPVTFKELHDHSGGGVPVYTLNHPGEKRVVLGTELPEVRAARRLREAGWWAAGVLAASIVSIRVYRVRARCSSRARPS